MKKTPVWQRKEGQNKKGGLNEKGRKSYEAANPGSDLKSPVKSGDNPRRLYERGEHLAKLMQSKKQQPFLLETRKSEPPKPARLCCESKTKIPAILQKPPSP